MIKGYTNHHIQNRTQPNSVLSGCPQVIGILCNETIEGKLKKIEKPIHE